MIEVHSSQLSADCLRAALLTIEGKSSGYTTGALLVGNVCHAAIRVLHERGKTWDRVECESAVLAGAIVADQTMKDDNRPPSDAVTQNRSEHLAEALKLVYAYACRCRLPDGSRLIGCELPIRATWEVDGEPFDFASHLDMLWRRADGSLVVRDWKSGSDSPSPMYLSRNMQLAVYHLAIGEGEVCVPTKEGSEWLTFGVYPDAEYCHLRNLLPYARATTTKGDDGRVEKFAAGDNRPLRSALIPVEYNDRGREAIRAEIAVRIRMMRSGLWPTNPQPESCRHCSVKPYCPAFDFPRSDQ